MSKSLSSFSNASKFFRGVDMQFFEDQNSAFIQQLKNADVLPDLTKKVDSYLDQGDKFFVYAMLAAAKYAPETAPIKNTMIERLSHLVEEHFDPNKANAITRDTFVDTIGEYLPLKEKPYKKLHDTIRSWQVSDSSIKHAAAQSGPEL